MTEILKKEENKVYFNIVIPADDIKKAEDNVYVKNKKYFSIPGFRKGKAPKKIIENVYGKEVFFEDAINDLLPKLYDEAVKELDLDVIDQPNVDIKEFNRGEDVTAEIIVEVKPEVTLGKYKGVEIEKVTHEVTEELINDAIENQREMNARKINIDDRPAKEGDVVNIDFKGFIDGEEFEGGSAEKQDIEIGSGTFIPGFEEQIVGKNVNDEFDINVNFPEDYSVEELKGKESKFEVKLNSISYKELPEVDDEFIKDISDFDTVEEYKEDIRKKKEEELKNAAKAEMERAAIDAVVEEIEVEVPKVMVDSFIDAEINNYEQNMRSQGFTFEAYLGMLGTDLDSFKENMRDDAEKSVKTSLALEAIIDEENFEVNDDEIKEEARKVAEKYFGDNKEKIDEMVDVMFNGDNERIKHDLKVRKAIDLIMENAIFKED